MRISFLAAQSSTNIKRSLLQPLSLRELNLFCVCESSLILFPTHGTGTDWFSRWAGGVLLAEIGQG